MWYGFGAMANGWRDGQVSDDANGEIILEGGLQCGQTGCHEHFAMGFGRLTALTALDSVCNVWRHTHGVGVCVQRWGCR